MYFLCGKCEERLSVWETAFKREIYDPFHTGGLHSVRYHSWVLKFATSLSWRVLRATIEAGDATPREIKLAAPPAEKTWRDFLLDKRTHPRHFSQYLFFLDSLANTRDRTVPINFASYIHRAEAAGIWHDPRRGSLFTFSMLCSIAVIGVISLGDASAWGQRLHVRGGVLTENGSIPPPEVVDMIKKQANDHLEMSRQFSDRQKSSSSTTGMRS
jgi:hypothetical protein